MQRAHKLKFQLKLQSRLYAIYYLIINYSNTYETNDENIRKMLHYKFYEDWDLDCFCSSMT